MKKFFSFVAIFIGLLLSQQAISQALNPGDIVVIGYASDAGPGGSLDEFSWVPLVNLPAGTKIYFTVAGYNTVDADFMGANESAEILLKYIAPAGGIAAGTVFTVVEGTLPAGYTAIAGTKFGNDFDGQLTIANAGQQFLVFQSTDDEFNTATFGNANFTPLFMVTGSTLSFSSLTTGEAGITPVSNIDNVTNLVPGLTDGVNAVAVGSGPLEADETDNARYEGATTGTREEILAAVTQLSNWGRYDAAFGNDLVIGSVATGWTANNAATFAVDAGAQLPGCVTNPSPVNGDLTVPVGPITLSWDPAIGGGTATGYDLYGGDTADTMDLIGSYTDTTTGDDLSINAYNVTIFWQIIATNDDGEAVGCDTWSFTTQSPPGYCLTASFGQYPNADFTPATCDGTTENVIETNCYAGEYSVVNVTAGQTYKFKSGSDDFITISSDAGATAAAYGPTPVTWVADVTGPVNFYSHVDNQCNEEDIDRVRSVVCGVVTADLPDYANLQYPGTAAFEAGNSVTVFGQVYENGLTNVEPGLSGQAAGIQAWIGVNTGNINPALWDESAWQPAAFNAAHVGNNDEYMLTIGADLNPGIYYYATRYKLNDGAYVYGGIDAGGNGDFWDGTVHNSGIMTITPPALPNCVSGPQPVNGDITVPVGAITLSWTAAATGGIATAYDLYAGNDPGTMNYVGTYTDVNTGTDLTIDDYNATVYWQIIATNVAGESTGCDVWSFTTVGSPGYCLTAGFGQYPSGDFTPDTCDGVTENVIETNCYAGEYSVVNVTSGQTYTFKSGSSDFITISTDDGATAATYGQTPLTWVSTVTGPVNFYTHADDQCTEEDIDRTRSVVCGTPSADSPDYANLQYPGNATIMQGESVTVFGQVYENGLTNVEPGVSGQAAGIMAWIGVYDTNTNPATWPTEAWTEAAFNSANIGNNDEYMLTIGSSLMPGTYYYATRYRLNTGGYVYGGIDAGGNGDFWDGAIHNSGVLTVTAAPAPVNDECAGAIALVPGGTFDAGAMTVTNISSTDTDGLTPDCQADFDSNVWFSVVAPASGTLSLETNAVDGSLMDDTVITAFSGSCGALTAIDCDDDGGDGLFSLLDLTGLTAGETLYVSVWRYSGLFADGAPGQFMMSAYDASLSTGTINDNGFKYYPNPVRDVLNLSSVAKDISNVEVFNLLGQQVLTKPVNAKVSQIDMSKLAAGTYIVKITADNQVKTVKVIKS